MVWYNITGRVAFIFRAQLISLKPESPLQCTLLQNLAQLVQIWNLLPFMGW